MLTRSALISTLALSLLGCATPPVATSPLERCRATPGPLMPMDLDGLNQATTPGAALLPSVLSALRIDSEQQQLMIEQRFAGMEDRSRAVLTITTEGLLDDAIAGQCYQLTLQRTPVAGWQFTQARQAVSCRRSDDTGYQGQPCP